MSPSTPILMYHALWAGCDDPEPLNALWDADPQLREPGARVYALDQRTFDHHLRQVVASGRKTLRSWNDLDLAPSEPTVWITFDDGHQSNLAFPPRPPPRCNRRMRC